MSSAMSIDDAEILWVRVSDENLMIAKKVTIPVKIWSKGLAGETSVQRAVTRIATAAARKTDNNE